MRLLRVRFKLATLLFAVAVVAANCWAFRRLNAVVIVNVGRATYRDLPADLGILPLANAALIGVAVHLTHRLRGANAGPRALGFAFFSLHFFVLVEVFRLMRPNAIPSQEGVLALVTEWAAIGWTRCFGEPGETVPWIVLDTLILGVCISGPPLLLSWIGRALAGRSRATLPPWRMRAMASLVSLGFASAALAICVEPQPYEEEREVDLSIQVVDEDSGRPIAGAFVRLDSPFEPNAATPKGFTGADGRVCLTRCFQASGERNAFRVMGRFSTWGRWLEVFAAGHRTRRIALPEVMGPTADAARPAPGKVCLARGKPPENAFADLAGQYSVRGIYGGRLLQIEPDGRFAWGIWSCTYRVQEYGYLTRRGGEVTLVPVARAGVETDPCLPLAYRAIPWGDRLYLCDSDERWLRQFCRAALTGFRMRLIDDESGSGSEPRDSVHPGRERMIPPGSEIYLRDSDRDKPRTGLPWLPAKVWVEVLTDEAQRIALKPALHDKVLVGSAICGPGALASDDPQ